MAQPMVQSVADAPSDDDVVSLRVDDLAVESTFREGGLHDEHVERLIGLRGHWPAILVSSATGAVIDGVHRVAAARRLGLERIDATYFDGSADEALIEFVRRNVYHGLALTLRERKRAARRVLHAHPRWSDRRIGELCAISPKTVGRLRVVPEGPAGEVPHLDAQTRVGRDNKTHPASSVGLRARVADAITQQPGASLRTIAAEVGVSPETVRSVRLTMGTASHLPMAAEASLSVREVIFPPPEPVPAPWKGDQAIATSVEGDDFLDWFERTSVSESDWWSRLDAVPISRIYEIADEARRRSEMWTEFARTLEDRTRKRR